jgi:hypothetical protein
MCNDQSFWSERQNSEWKFRIGLLLLPMRVKNVNLLPYCAWQENKKPEHLKLFSDSRSQSRGLQTLRRKTKKAHMCSAYQL